MGCDCAPFLANLYLFWYEYRYVKDLVAAKSFSIKYFKFCCRYIDDLFVPNGINDFNRVYNKEIYPECLVLDQLILSFPQVEA